MSPPADATTALALHEVRAGYGETVILEGITLSLPSRGALSVLGRNGVGKTTLVSTIVGHTTLHSGSIRLRECDMTAFAPHRRSRLGIGWVPQEREIFRSLTVEENLQVAARHGRWNLARVYDLFPALAERRRHRGNELSGGEQQMLAIGRALMGSPAVLLMDEPLEGLAPTIVDAVARGIERLRRDDDVAIVLIEQHTRMVLSLTEEAIVLDRGRIVHSGRSRALLDAPERLAVLMGVERHQVLETRVQ
jgi:branched-chain amino acid transport system ATP-binding protein